MGGILIRVLLLFCPRNNLVHIWGAIDAVGQNSGIRLASVCKVLHVLKVWVWDCSEMWDL